MRYAVRVKTGFFKTAPYWLSVERGCLRLTPSAGAGEREQVYYDNALFSVILLAGKSACIEIRGRERLVDATLTDGGQLPELLRTLRQNLTTNITCEFRGDGSAPL